MTRPHTTLRIRTAFILSGIACIPRFGGCVAPPDYSGATLYSGFTRVDPETRTRTEDAWLVVKDDVIVDTGAGAPPARDFDAAYDLSGLYGMPGLIDAHAHITAGPQEAGLVEGVPSIAISSGDEFSRFQGAVALAFGVTTVRNPGGSTAANARYDSMVASRQWIGPQALHAGEVIQPPPFGGESFAYPTTTHEWDAEAAAQAAAGMTYFKLYTDLTEDELAEGVRAAKAHGLTPIAHLNAVSWTRAVELGVEQLEHALPTSPDLLEPEAREQYLFGPDYITRWFELADLDGPLMREMIATLARHRIAVDLTLLVNEMVYFADQVEEEFEINVHSGYVHPDQVSALTTAYERMAATHSPEHFERSRALWPKVLEFARVLHDAGVPLMIGTDGTGGGPLYARELHNHVQAGIPAWEVLHMATSGNAEKMGLGEVTGRIRPGMEADVVFLRADPVEDVRHVREVEMVVTNGQAHRFEDLVAVARGLIE